MVQHFVLELSHCSLPAPIVLHCVGPSTGAFRVPRESGPFVYSFRDAPTEIHNLTPSQPSRQVLPKTLSVATPVAVKLSFNNEVLFEKDVTEWSYNDAQHVCYLRVDPDVVLECAEVAQNVVRKPFVPYWRDTTESRYVFAMEIDKVFFTTERMAQLRRLSQ